jgi:hypothetical protein
VLNKDLTMRLAIGRGKHYLEIGKARLYADEVKVKR